METTKLPAADRPRERHRYKVSGTGYFPVDMLRYDACVPATGADASAIDLHNIDRRPVRLYRFSQSRASKPEAARWQSFGWRVVSDEPAL